MVIAATSVHIHLINKGKTLPQSTLWFQFQKRLISLATIFSNTKNSRVEKISFSGAQKSMLLKASSGERCATHNFVHLVTLQGTRVHLKVYLVMHQMKYVMER